MVSAEARSRERLDQHKHHQLGPQRVKRGQNEGRLLDILDSREQDIKAIQLQTSSILPKKGGGVGRSNPTGDSEISRAAPATTGLGVGKAISS